MSMNWIERFVGDLARTRLPNVFNPYADVCSTFDLPEAPLIRRTNLELMLRSCSARGVESIWFGRDLGWRGGRRTGLALTDEGHLPMMRQVLGAPDIARATLGPGMHERTATVIWGVIDRLPRPPVLWNAFPLHPHERDDQLSNRAHTQSERRHTAWAIERLVEELRPKHLIAIGNDAAAALASFGVTFTQVRHPSYGGQTEFVASMEAIHGLAPARREAPDLFDA